MDIDTMTMTMAPAMALALTASFGSVTRWRDDFLGCGTAGTGVRELRFRPRHGTLVNRWVASPAEPAAENPAEPEHEEIALLALPDTRVDAIDWTALYERYQAAVHDASEAFGATPDEVAAATLVDVRRAAVFAQADVRVPGARWRDPAEVGRWAGELSRERPVIVYCVYGHEVGRATALRLRAAGVPARFLRGGISAWQAAGRPLEGKGETP